MNLMDYIITRTISYSTGIKNQLIIHMNLQIITKFIYQIKIS